jgi:hypothetical protein
LIHRGKILSLGDQKLKSKYNVKPNDTIILIDINNINPHKPDTPQQNPLTNTIISENNISSNREDPFYLYTIQNCVPIYNVAALPMPADPSKIEQLVGMGFERANVIDCLRAAENHSNLAVEYLMNGIPKEEEEEESDQDEPSMDANGRLQNLHGGDNGLPVVPEEEEQNDLLEDD